MRDKNRDGHMTVIPNLLLHLFNSRGYPRIEPSTHELTWWIDKKYYEDRIKALQGMGVVSPEILVSEDFLKTPQRKV
jgi:hypothetical protein